MSDPHAHQPQKPDGAGGSGTEDDAELTRLALLKSLDYARVRKEAATRLSGGSVTFLDAAVKSKRRELGIDNRDDRQGQAIAFEEPEPWLEPVDVDALLDDVVRAASRFVVLPQHGPEKIALWVLHTYVADACDYTPRLEISAATRECGKTTLLDFLSLVVYRPLISANVTAAAFFRVVAQHRPTLLIDEVDSFASEDSDIRNVLNSGHHVSGHVLRTVGDNYEPRSFPCFAAVAYAHIGELPRAYSTLVSRSIRIDLKRRLPREEVQSLSEPRRRNEFADLRRRLKRFADDDRATLAAAEPKVPVSVVNRLADNWRPLLAIAELAGGEWPERARDAIGRAELESSASEMLLADIRDLLSAKPAREIASAALAAELGELDGHPWAEMGKNRKPLTQNRLARMLKPFGVGPDKIGPEGKRLNGYRLERFKDAFERYLPGTGWPTTGQADIDQQDQALTEISKPDSPDVLSGLQNRGNPRNSSVLSGCPLENGVKSDTIGKRPPREASGPLSDPPSTRRADPPRTPARRPYEILLGGAGGERCSLCGGGAFVRRIRYNGQIKYWHQNCAEKYITTVANGSGKGPDLGPRDAPQPASVPVMLTQDMKRRLRACGYSDEAIAHLTTQQAHEILSQEGRLP